MDKRFDQLPPGAVGVGTYGGMTVRYFTVSGDFKIGKYCSVAAETEVLLGGNHRTDYVTTYPFPKLHPQFFTDLEYSNSRGDVTIGSDVWIGRGATILSGVTIGDGAIVGARAVLAKSVEPYTIVVGNPARVIGKRFDDDVIEAMLRIRWWDWPEARIHAAMPYIMSADVRRFIAAVDADEI